MTRIKITKAIVYAAALDAANRIKRRKQLAAWDEEANDAYHAEFERLLAVVGGDEGWMDLPRD
jgi:hypothetical protein